MAGRLIVLVILTVENGCLLLLLSVSIHRGLRHLLLLLDHSRKHHAPVVLHNVRQALVSRVEGFVVALIVAAASLRVCKAIIIIIRVSFSLLLWEGEESFALTGIAFSLDLRVLPRHTRYPLCLIKGIGSTRHLRELVDVGINIL